MIQYIDTFVPEDRLAIDAIFAEAHAKGRLPAAFSSPAEGVAFFQDTLSLRSVAYHDGLTEADMLGVLLARFIHNQVADPLQIDLLITIGDAPNHSPSVVNAGHYLQHLYGFPQAQVLTLSGNHCANTEYAVLLAESLLKAGDAHHILVLNASVFRQHSARLVGSYGVHGDGAGLLYLSAGEGEGIRVLGNHSYTNGLLYKAAVDDPLNSLVICKNYLVCLSGFLQKYAIRAAEIALILVQNANYLLVHQCLQRVGFQQPPLFLDNMPRYGHLDSVDFIVNLQSVLDGPLAGGSRFFSFGTGWAGSNCCLYLQKGPDVPQ